MRTYTIIGSVNGVGKSSFTGVLKERCTDLGIGQNYRRAVWEYPCRGQGCLEENQ